MQPSSIPWELIWRIARVAFLAVMAELTREMSPLVVQGDTPVTFGPGFMAGLLGLLSAAEAVYAALKMFGIFKTKDVPAVKAERPVGVADIQYLSSKIDGLAGILVGARTAGRVANPSPPFSGPLHNPKDDTPQAAA